MYSHSLSEMFSSPLLTTVASIGCPVALNPLSSRLKTSTSNFFAISNVLSLEPSLITIILYGTKV